MHEAPLSTNKYKDGYYGLPLDTNTRIAIFNNSLLEKAGVKEVPADFDTLIEETKDIIGKDTFLFGPSGSSTWGLMPYFYSLGGVFTNEDYTKATGFLDSKDSIKALQTIVDWNKAGYFGKSLTGISRQMKQCKIKLPIHNFQKVKQVVSKLSVEKIQLSLNQVSKKKKPISLLNIWHQMTCKPFLPKSLVCYQ